MRFWCVSQHGTLPAIITRQGYAVEQGGVCGAWALDIYSHAMPSMQKDAVDRFEMALEIPK